MISKVWMLMPSSCIEMKRTSLSHALSHFLPLIISKRMVEQGVDPPPPPPHTHTHLPDCVSCRKYEVPDAPN